MSSLAVSVGGIECKNPVWCGSCEVTMTEQGIRACLDAGAGAVVAKSINEVPDAARQLDIADYALIDERHRPVDWEAVPPGAPASLFCRSGLAQTPLDEWVEILGRCDEHAAREGAYVIGSITASGLEEAAQLTARLAEATRVVELNLGAIHAKEAPGGAIRLAATPEAVARYTSEAKRASGARLIVKLSPQTEDVAALAVAAAEGGADAVAMIGRFPGFLPDPHTMEPVLGSWGAVGGGWMLPVSLYWVSKTRRRAGASLPIVGTGGARSGLDIARFLLSGASAVEVASPLLAEGPGAVTRLLRELEDYAAEVPAHGLKELVGLAADRARTYQEISADTEATSSEPPWRRFVVDGAGDPSR